MAEAAKKEPSMEDILSSIRKIIAEEGGNEEAQVAAPAQPEMSQETSVDMSADIRPSIEADSIQMDSPAVEAQMAAPVVEPSVEVSAEEAPAAPYVEPETASRVVSEMPVAPEVPADAPEATASLAAIAASIQGVAQTAQTEEATPAEVEAPIEPSAPVTEHFEEPPAIEEQVMHQEPIHVEMAEAIPAPSVEIEQPAVAAPSVEDMVREEEAFRGALMSPSADHAVTDSFDRLKRSAMDDIEATTEAILRPMLREWLDEHLPTLVEKLVREEIERVARG